jgi:hypothetical protein
VNNTLQKIVCFFAKIGIFAKIGVFIAIFASPQKNQQQDFAVITRRN